MTLLELANFICAKVNQTETEDVAACKTFLTRRHDMLWADQLWKDSLVEYRVTLDPDVADYVVTSNWLPTKGVLLLPPIIQRVIAVRSSANALRVQRQEYFYRIDYDAFAKTGAAAEFVILPPCVWEWNTAQTVLVKRNAADAEAAIVADLLDSDGAGVSRVTQVLTDDFVSLGSSERVDALSKAATSGSVIVGAPGPTTITHLSLLTGTTYFYFSATPITSVTGRTPAATLEYGETATVTPLAYIAASQATTGAPSDTDDVPGGAAFGGAIAYGGLVAIGFTRANPSGVTLAAADTNGKRRQRLRLVQIPTAETVLRVLGKRSAPTFSADNDEPGISGMENCLLAFAHADMLERDESDPTLKLAEATQLLEQLKRLETVQQAHSSRIMPEGGYGGRGAGGGRADSANPLGW